MALVFKTFKQAVLGSGDLSSGADWSQLEPWSIKTMQMEQPTTREETAARIAIRHKICLIHDKWSIDGTIHDNLCS